MCFGEPIGYGAGYYESMAGKKKMEMPYPPIMGMGHHIGHHMMGMAGMGICPWCHGAGFIMHGRAYKDPMMLAKHAKKELLYEKIKTRIERRYGDKLDKVADEIVEITSQKMHMKLEFMKKKMEMKARIWEMMADILEEEGEEAMQEPPPQGEWQEG
jgi:hypothetical protein